MMKSNILTPTRPLVVCSKFERFKEYLAMKGISLSTVHSMCDR